MRKEIKAKACGSTGLADALTKALKLDAHKKMTALANSGGKLAKSASIALVVIETADNVAEALSTGGVAFPSGGRSGKTEAGRQWAKENGGTVITQETFDKLNKRTPSAYTDFNPEVTGNWANKPDPLAERIKREEQAKLIAKLSNIVKRAEPRLLMELLQDFGSIEGLSAPRQADLIKRLERIRKDYRI